MFQNSSDIDIDVRLLKVETKYLQNESSARLLNGSWVFQTVGNETETLSVQLLCNRDTLIEIAEYALNKEQLTIGMFGDEWTAIILEQPTFEIQKTDKINPIYLVAFEMAVV